MDNFLSEAELDEIGLTNRGKGVLVGRHTVLYAPERLVVGDHVRIDDFTVVSGRVELGSYIHISQFCGLYGGDEGIFMGDFSGLSSKCSVYATSDDYSGNSMTNPMVPAKYKPGAINAAVRIGRHAIIGCNGVVLPGVDVAEGTSVGSMSLVTRSTEPWGVYVGIPAKRRGERSRGLLDLEAEFLAELDNQ